MWPGFADHFFSKSSVPAVVKRSAEVVTLFVSTQIHKRKEEKVAKPLGHSQ